MSLKLYRVIVCGARDWTDRDMIADTLQSIALKTAKRGAIFQIVHGGATGADQLAGDIGEQIGANVQPMPAEWRSFGRAAGPIRNRAMLAQLRPAIVLAFHDAIHTSKGTADMLRAAARSGVPFLLISHADKGVEMTGQPTLL